MPSVLSYTNAFLGIPVPQHTSGQASVKSFLFPGALQPLVTGLSVLSYTNAFLGIPMPQHFSGQSVVQSYRYPGAFQPQTPRAAGYPTTWAITITIGQ
jgi:hypothetical protein